VADSEERLEIEVGYRGSEAFDRFARDMEVLPGELKEVVDALGAVPGAHQGALRKHGEAMARFIKAGFALELANMQGLLGQTMKGFDLGQFAAQGALPTGTSTRQVQAVASAINQVARDTQNANRRLMASSDLGPQIAQIQALTRAANNSGEAFKNQAAAQQKAANTPTPIQRDVQTIEKANVGRGAKDALATAAAAPAAGAVKPADAARMEAVRALSTPPSVEVQREMGATWPKQHFEAVAAAAGMTTAELRKAAAEYPELAKATRAEAAARQAAAQEARATAAEQRRRSGITAIEQAPALNGLFPGAPTSRGPVDARLALAQQRENEARATASRMGSFFSGSAQAEMPARRVQTSWAADEARLEREQQARGVQQEQALRMDRERTERLQRQQQAAGVVHERAIREDMARTEKRQRDAQAAGVLQTRAEREDAQRAERQQRQQQAAGVTQTRAERMDAERTARQQREAQAAGVVQTRAEREDAQRAARQQREAQSGGVLQTRAERMDRERTERQQREVQAGGTLQARAEAEDRRRREAAERQQRAVLRAETQAYAERTRRERQGMGFGQQVAAGFRGSDERPVGEMIGQTARVSLFYGVAFRMLGMLQQGLEAAVLETVAYEESLTALNVVTGRTRAENDRFAETLGDIAVAAGFTPSQGLDLGSRALGLYGVASADQATQERTVEISTAVATRMARVSGGDPVATQTQLAGALRSLGWGIERLPELEDSVSYISRQTGQAPSELLGALANVATLGTQSGFTPQQLAALIAQVGTTTGQNPEGTAGQFRQLLSRNASEIAPRASSIVGADLTGMDLQEIFSTVSQMKLSADQLNRFASLFGKGGSQQVATILTQQYGEVQRLSTGADEAQGFGREAFDEVMGSFGNKIREMGAVFADFGVTLIETGLLDWIGAMVIGATELMRAGTAVLDVINQIPRPMRAVALALGEVYAAALIASRMGVGGTLGRMADGVSGRTAFGRRQIQAGNARRAESGGSGPGDGLVFGIPSWAREPIARVPRGDRTTMRASLNPWERAQGATGLTTGGIAAAAGIAGLSLYGVAKGVEIEREADQMVRQAEAASAAASTLEELRDSAANASESLAKLRSGGLGELAPGDVMGLLPAFLNSILTGGEQAELQRIQENDTQRADVQEAAREAAIAADASNIFGDFSTEGIETGLQGLADQGYNAEQRLALLNRAMFDFVNSAGSMTGAVAVIERAEFDPIGTQVGQAGVDAVERARSLMQVTRDNLVLNDGAVSGLPQVLDPIEDRLPWSQASRANGRLDRFTFSTEDKTALSEALNTATQGALEDVVASDGILTEGGQEEIIARAQEALRSQLGEERWADIVADGQEAIFTTAMDSAVRGILGGFGVDLTGENMSDFMRMAPELAAAGAQNVTRRTGSQVAGNQYMLDYLQQARVNLLATAGEQKGGFTEEQQRLLDTLDTDIAVAARSVVDDRIAAIRSVAQYRTSLLKGDDVLGRLAIERQSIAQERAADKEKGGAGGYDRNLGTYVAPTAEYAAAERERMSRAAAANQAERAERAAIAQNRATAYISPGNAIGMAAGQITAARGALRELEEGSSQWWAAQGQLTAAQYSYSQTVVQAANANRLAGVDPRNDVGRIEAQIANAQAEMSLLPANQRGGLRDQVNQLNQQHAEAIVAQANALASANIAGNQSALVGGRVAIDNAQRSLSTQLPGTTAYYSALGALRESQSQLAQAERDQADRVRRLGSDLTDPVEQARLDVQKAREQLAANQASGQGPDIIAQSQLDVRGAENSAEQAAFSQRISDLQTAEDLGRISHSAYMSYLQSEHDRLSAIGDRTRQQQDQLDQVDKLMKSAAEEMQGQFNIGDIDLPSVYQVRRAMQAGAPTQAADYSNSNNVVNVNGADFGAVVEWLTNYLGTGAQVVTAATPRRI